MSEKLLLHLLKQHEASPETKFYESDLTRISSTQFQSLKKQKYLLFDQYDFEKESYFDKQGNERFIRRFNGKLTATSTDDPEASAIYLKDQDLNRYVFNIKPLCEAIKKQNNLTKNIDEVSQRVSFIGESVLLQKNIGVFLARTSDDEQAESELLGLRSKIGKVDCVLVLCPAYEIKSQDLLSRLAGQGITCLNFRNAFKGSDFKINFGNLFSNQIVTASDIKLKPQQAQDYKKHQYQTKDSLYLPGIQPKLKSNQIGINGFKVGIGDSLFVLLLRFVVAAKKNAKKGGWENPGFDPGKHQPSSNLRTAIQGSLASKDGQKFIESNGSKEYRISTHPDFISYDRGQLLQHPLSSVKDLAKKLPK